MRHMGTVEAQFAGWVGSGSASTADIAPNAHEPAQTQTRSPGDVITALVLEYSTTLYRVAYSITRNASEAEDAVQEAFLRVLRHQEKLAEIRDIRIWLIRITWNLVLDRKRRTKVRPETEDIADLARTLPAIQPSADETLASSQTCMRILSLMDTLPAKEREALMLSAIEELSTTEIAGVLGTTESSVRSRIFRARRALSQLLEAERTLG
jgi:RNA polymerase sigma-70 factor (ECF subfamily)